jgi:hypothetical protein
VKAVALVELALLFEESIGVGWRASVLVGDSDCCWSVKWRSSSWCFS